MAVDGVAAAVREALAVDRDVFSRSITEKLKSHPLIRIESGEITSPFTGENEITLIATGPLTSDRLAGWIAKATGEEDLYFYDAIAPILEASSIDMTSAFTANRYDKGGEEAYINCPLTKEEYDAFIDAQENRSLLARDEDLPSGDELGAAFEKFLAQQGKKFDDDDKG